MQSRLSRLAAPLLAVALLVGPAATAFPGVALAQNTAQDAYNSARDMLQQNNYAGAIDAFSRTLGMDPSLAQAYVGRATAYVYEGNAQAALQDYDQALQLQPDMAEALYNRGVLLAQSGDASAAVGDLQRAAELFRQRGDEQTAGLVGQALNALQQ